MRRWGGGRRRGGRQGYDEEVWRVCLGWCGVDVGGVFGLDIDP